LSNCHFFPSKKTGRDIGCSKDEGPCFAGSGSCELTAWDEPFNDYDKCCSWANSSSYDIPMDDTGINLLTNKTGISFTISELEVWEVTFLE
jgi:hypothetical protein